MNKRIRKKRERQQIIWAVNGLVTEARKEEQRRQAALRKFIKDCERLYEKNRAHLQEDARNE